MNCAFSSFSDWQQIRSALPLDGCGMFVQYEQGWWPKTLTWVLNLFWNQLKRVSMCVSVRVCAQGVEGWVSRLDFIIWLINQCWWQLEVWNWIRYCVIKIRVAVSATHHHKFKSVVWCHSHLWYSGTIFALILLCKSFFFLICHFHLFLVETNLKTHSSRFCCQHYFVMELFMFT